MGRLKVEQELRIYGRCQAFFACMSLSCNGADLKQFFLKEFSEELRGKLQVFNRKEICEYCGVEDSEDSTGIQLVHKLVDKLPSNSVMFLDECPIKNSKKDSTDWTGLINPREDEISLIMSFQPIDFYPTLAAKELKLILPEKSNTIHLSHQYRSTEKIFSFNNSLHSQVPVHHSGLDARPCDSVTGPGVVVVNIGDNTNLSDVKTWIHYHLWKMHCSQHQVKVLNTKSTEDEANMLFADTAFSGCITNMNKQAGAELCQAQESLGLLGLD